MPRPAFGSHAVDISGENDMCCAPGCEAPNVLASRAVPLCDRHAIRVLGDLMVFTRAYSENRPRSGDPVPGALGIPLVEKIYHVYYVQFADRIKIGVTSDLVARLSALPHDALLAVEKGDHERERERHKQFAGDRISGEWFVMSDDLMRHIEELVSREHELGPGMRRFLRMRRAAAA